LPPTVLGFYLLIMLGPNGWLGKPVAALTGSPLSFSFTGLVIASTLYSLPFVVQPLHTTFESIGKGPLEAAWTLGASKWDAFWTVATPLALRGYITAIVLGFAHTLGEFGVVLMVGGSIPGKTKVISIEIYDRVEIMEYTQAHILSGGLLIFSFVVLLIVYSVNRRLPIHVS
jgi:molybdate transport system permease protein